LGTLWEGEGVGSSSGFFWIRVFYCERWDRKRRAGKERGRGRRVGG